MTQNRRILKTALKYGVNFILAAAATLGLFLLMIMLINTNFQPASKPNPPSFINVVKETPKKSPDDTKIRKKKTEMEKLLEPVSSPPFVTFKAKKIKPPPPEYSLTTLNPSVLEKLATQPNFNVNIALPTVSYAPGASGMGSSLSGSSSHGVKKFGASGNSQGGVNICTIAFVLDSDGVSVSELQWIGCQDGAISNDAEKALYKWVDESPKSYTDLNPTAGDTIEFTFERR